MGCWNETDMLTGLQISHGDDVVMFPLATNTNFSRENWEWKLMSLPVIGEYDDYGFLENIVGGPESDLFFKAMAEYYEFSDLAELGEKIHSEPVADFLDLPEKGLNFYFRWGFVDLGVYSNIRQRFGFTEGDPKLDAAIEAGPPPEDEIDRKLWRYSNRNVKTVFYRLRYYLQDSQSFILDKVINNLAGFKYSLNRFEDFTSAMALTRRMIEPGNRTQTVEYKYHKTLALWVAELAQQKQEEYDEE